MQEVEGESNLNFSFKLVIAKIRIVYPTINVNNLDFFYRLYIWYVEHEDIDRELPIIDSYNLMEVEESFITLLELNIFYYREFIDIGKGYTSYLPSTS